MILEKILNTLTDRDFKDFMNGISMVVENRRLVLEGVKKPIVIDQISSLGISGVPTSVILHKVYLLESLGIFTSELEPRDNEFIRVFYPTELAKRLVKLC